MNISIFGLGYVGCVSLGCFAKLKHNVIGVEINKKKVELINKGQSHIIEPGLNELVSNGVKNKNIKATRDYKWAIKNSDVSFVCIGTPGKKDGNLNLKPLFNSLIQIAEGLKLKNIYHTIVIRSTVHPGSYDKIINILEKYSDKKKEKDFCVVINPEFLREGSAVQDFFNPPMNVIGTDCGKSITILKKIYSFNKAPVIIVSENIAELIKLVSNAFHSIKISFANEIGNVCKKLNIDSFEIMRLLALDKKLNISSAYLKPGFAFGGSCLPKDLKALNKIAKSNLLELPLISNVISSNEFQKQLTFDLIKSLKEKNIGIWGLSFKIGTDDLRGSPIIDVVKMLIKNGYNVKLFDENIDLKKLIGVNKTYIYKKLPVIDKLFEKNFDALLKFSKVLVVNSNNVKLLNKINKHNNLKIVDLVNIDELRSKNNYYGLCS
ncbi:MAG: nucleotide sugar dehydrogenase [Ignavibacteria bacterium]|jgi:GDP-mannose 6-dehydrogenase